MTTLKELFSITPVLDLGRDVTSVKYGSAKLKEYVYIKCKFCLQKRICTTEVRMDGLVTEILQINIQVLGL